MYEVLNESTGEVVARKVKKATTLLERTKGLIGSAALSPDQGLWIMPCKSIHTFFMRFSIDAVFIGPSGAVVGIERELKPCRISAVYWSAASVLELPAGVISKTHTSIGHQLRFREIA